MSRVFWDTNLFIYWLEGSGASAFAARRLHAAMRARGDQLYTSALAIGEVLVKPAEQGDVDRARLIEQTISGLAIVLPFGLAEARRFASVRQDRSIRAPDAIHLACAAAARMDLFVTNDNRLQGKHIEGIQFIVPLDRAPL